MMSPPRRITLWHLLATIFALGCTNLVLSVISPTSQLAIWLDNYWQRVSVLIAVFYIFYRLLPIARPFLTSTFRSAQQTNIVSVPKPPFWSDGVPALADLPVHSIEWNRAKVIHDGATLPVADAVYRIIEFNERCSEFSIVPSELAWLSSADHFAIWSKRARKLRDAAYSVGDAGLSKNGTYDKVRKKFIADNPGFSNETYDRAVSYGYEQAH